MVGDNGTTPIEKQNQFNIMYRIVITGAESTGKTTLAEQLSAHFEAPCSTEFVRDYEESKEQHIQIED